MRSRAHFLPHADTRRTRRPAAPRATRRSSTRPDRPVRRPPASSAANRTQEAGVAKPRRPTSDAYHVMEAPVGYQIRCVAAWRASPRDELRLVRSRHEGRRMTWAPAVCGPLPCLRPVGWWLRSPAPAGATSPTPQWREARGDVTVRRCVSVPLASTAAARREGMYTAVPSPPIWRGAPPLTGIP